MSLAPGILGALGLTDADLHSDILRQLKSGEWLVLSEGGKQLGIFENEEEARERLRQIEAAKAAKDSRSDSRVVSRCDRIGPIRFVETKEDAEALDIDTFAARLTDQGYLRIEGRISGLGVYQYQDAEGNEWGELRLAEHVFAEDALESFQLVPLTDDHPEDMVDAESIGDVQRGHLGSNVRPNEEGTHVVADMLITAPELIKKIQGGKTELSCGYEAVVLDESGTTEDGVSYDAVQTEIRGNHLAVVDQARGGPTCRLLFDAVGVTSAVRPDNREGGPTETKTPTPKETTMLVKRNKDGKLMIGETEFEVPDAVAAAFEAMSQKLEGDAKAKDEEGEEQDAQAKDMEGEEAKDMEGEEEQDAKDAKDTQDSAKVLARLQAKIDVLEGQLAQSSTKIDARVNLVTRAKEILGPDTKTDGVGDIALKKAVVGSVMPNLKAKVDSSKSADYVDAMYEAAIEQFSSRVDHTTELMELTHQAAQRGDAASVDLDALVSEYQDGLRTRAEKEAN